MKFLLNLMDEDGVLLDQYSVVTTMKEVWNRAIPSDFLVDDLPRRIKEEIELRQHIRERAEGTLPHGA